MFILGRVNFRSFIFGLPSKQNRWGRKGNLERFAQPNIPNLANLDKFLPPFPFPLVLAFHLILANKSALLPKFVLK